MLNDKQQRFCEEYLVDLCGSAAARRAGYSERSAKVTACGLLKKLDIQAEVQRLKELRTARSNATADRTIAEIAKIAFVRIDQVADFDGHTWRLKPFSEIPNDAKCAISELSYLSGGKSKIKLHDKCKALELLGRHFALFLDRAEVTDKTPQPCVTDDLTEDVWEDFGAALMHISIQKRGQHGSNR